jgi:hypothetical protein
MRGRRFFCSGGGPPSCVRSRRPPFQWQRRSYRQAMVRMSSLASAFVVSGGVWKFLFEAGMSGSGFHKMLGGAPETIVRVRCREVRWASGLSHQQEPEMLVSTL